MHVYTFEDCSISTFSLFSNQFVGIPVKCTFVTMVLLLSLLLLFLCILLEIWFLHYLHILSFVFISSEGFACFSLIVFMCTVMRKAYGFFMACGILKISGVPRNFVELRLG